MSKELVLAGCFWRDFHHSRAWKTNDRNEEENILALYREKEPFFGNGLQRVKQIVTEIQLVTDLQYILVLF
jgi:hypothetical protein